MTGRTKTGSIKRFAECFHKATSPPCEINVVSFCDLPRARVDRFATMPHKHKIVIAGNHDMALDPKAYRASRLYRANSNGCEEAANIMRKTKRRKKTQEEKSSNKGEADSDEPAFIYLEDESVQVEGYKFYGSPVTPVLFL
eukprot:jgi/Bigna1/133128/aug1.20_g7836